MGGRYNRVQLRAMAQGVIAAKKANDMRYLQFLMKMMLTTGMTAPEIERRIAAFAQ